VGVPLILDGKYQILGFGDSLTEGWHQFGTKFNPYSSRLQMLLDDAFPNKFNIVNMGLAGEMTFDMDRRLKEILNMATNNNFRYSHVIILGGTNDLGRVSATDIFTNLTTLYNHVETHGAKIICITIPQSYFTTAFYVQKRTEVNRDIKKNSK